MEFLLQLGTVLPLQLCKLPFLVYFSTFDCLNVHMHFQSVSVTSFLGFFLIIFRLTDMFQKPFTALQFGEKLKITRHLLDISTCLRSIKTFIFCTLDCSYLTTLARFFYFVLKYLYLKGWLESGGFIAECFCRQRKQYVLVLSNIFDTFIIFVKNLQVHITQ